MKTTITDQCTGCRACEQICPQSAIRLIENKESFLVAMIDTEKCADCGLCHKVCPQENVIVYKKDNHVKAYAAQINDRKVLMESSSGGFFTALANDVLSRGGIVFGVNLTENNHAVYIRVNSVEELAKIRGSKYLASDTQKTYQEVKKLLSEGREVLYSGLPCHIAGLRAFLRKNYEKLLLVDVICHGTPSIRLFDVYLAGMGQRMGAPLHDYLFRDKSRHGWGCYWSYRYGSNGQKNGGQFDDPYMSAFIGGYAKRDSCYECHYTGINHRPGDITLGDFWGIDRVHLDMASNRGVSAVIAHTPKGNAACEKAMKQCRWVVSNTDNIAHHNPNLVRAEKRPTRRQHLYDGINEKSPVQFIEQNLRLSLKGIVKTKLRLLMPYWLRIWLKKMF